MRFLHISEAAAWCRERGMRIDDPWSLALDSRLVHHAELAFAPHGRSGREPAAADACLGALGDWDECLLWITETGIWPSSEDWPTFYAARGSRGEPGSLSYKPAQAFARGEEDDLRLFVQLVLENGWDAHLLPMHRRHSDRRFWFSHDGIIELQSLAPADFALPAV